MSKQIYTAFSGLKTTELSDRKVVDSIQGLIRKHNSAYDPNEPISASNPKWLYDTPTFSGTDRPEKHTTLDGVHQVCVEKEETNIVAESDFTKSWWTHDNVSVDESAEKLFGYKTYIMRELDSGDTVKRINKVGQLLPSGDYDRWNSVYVKPIHNARYFYIATANAAANIGNTGITVDFETGTVETIGVDDYTFQSIGNGWFYVAIRRRADTTSSGLRSYMVGFINQLVVGNDVAAYDDYQDRTAIVALPEAFHSNEGEDGKRYPTQPIWSEGGETTRLAPSPVIEDALPETGTVAGVFNAVKEYMGGSGSGYLAVYNSVSGDVSRFLFVRGVSGLVRFLVSVFGDTGGRVESFYPSDWFEYERRDFAYIVTYDSSNIKFWLLDGSDNTIRKFSSSNQINDSSIKDVTIGARTGEISSVRFEVPLRKDEIVRVNATDDEIKAFFEQITAGTSMEMKASEMTIV